MGGRLAIQKDTHLQNARGIREELLRLIEGMDYCLDWKPDQETWSVREVLNHLLDTPPGGMSRVIEGIMSGELSEFDLWSDVSEMTPERLGRDIEFVRQEIAEFFRRMEASLGAAREEDFTGKSVMVHQRNRGWDEQRTAENLLLGLFARHWREHLDQVRELRDTLGMG